jgi:hypothetical protein
MKLREIQAELKDMGVSYSDCFDRDILTRRLKEARSGKVKKTLASFSCCAVVALRVFVISILFLSLTFT